MKILYVITGLMRGGAERQLFNLASGIKHDVVVLNFTGGELEKEFKKKKIPVRTLNIKSKAQFMKAVSGIKKHIEKEKPDIVHSFLPHANIACKLAKLSAKHKFKLICSVRVKETKFFLQNLGERLFDSACDIITTNAETTKKYLVKSWDFKAKKIRVIPNGVVFHRASVAKLYPKKKLVLTVGNFRKQKDYPTNVQVAKDVCAVRDDVLFAYVGTGSEEEKIKSLVKRAGLTKQVAFLGSRPDVPNLMKRADVFFLPTLYEGQSNVLIEAMQYQCPIVTTDIPENKEVVDGAAILTPVGDARRMVTSLLRVLEKKPVSMVHKAFKRSKAFSVKEMVKNHEELYQECVES